MLTRLKVSGFKNLVGVDIRFGPFTCIAGANGVGKSNLFDAIRFLSATADDTLVEAAASVRGEEGRTSDVRSIFHIAGANRDEEISFEAEMIVPGEGIDDLGQRATASTTFLSYKLTLEYNTEKGISSVGSIFIKEESLGFIALGQAKKNLGFPNNPEWFKSVKQKTRTVPFISTEADSDGNRIIKLHQDQRKGRPKDFSAVNLPRTVLSTVNALESPTALLARREIQSWQLLQLEPSALRKPDDYTTQAGLQANGARLAATLHHLAKSKGNGGGFFGPDVYHRVANRLSDLISDVRAIRVDEDAKRELLTVVVTDHDGTEHPARSLSDGTLRFLALSVLELDNRSGGLLCLEEPENGIHPERIPAMLNLLKDIACDVNYPVGPDNPLRQVLINTHSPGVVREIMDSDLLVAELKEMVVDGLRFKRACFSWLSKTWRAKQYPDAHTVNRGALLAYLGNIEDDDGVNHPEGGKRKPPVKIGEREDLLPEQMPLF